MACWLLKTEPTCYSWADLLSDKSTTWDGVTNALALKHLRGMKKGDLALIYHTGTQRQAVGVAEITSSAQPEPGKIDPKSVVVSLKPLKALPRPISLDEFKADPAFAGWELLRISRLSVMPVPPAMWKRIQQLSRKANHDRRPPATITRTPAAQARRRL